MKIISISFLSLCLSMSALHGQDRLVRLKVVDTYGRAFPGVEVSVPGAPAPAVTDADGIAELSAPDGVDAELSVFNEYFHLVNVDGGRFSRDAVYQNQHGISAERALSAHIKYRTAIFRPLS